MTALALYNGRARRPLVLIVPDLAHPNMWRLAWPDGRVSDLVNLARAKDAALVLCARGLPRRDAQRLQFKKHRCESPREAREFVFPTRPYPSGPALAEAHL
jgi:hypothetical protein